MSLVTPATKGVKLRKGSSYGNVIKTQDGIDTLCVTFFAHDIILLIYKVGALHRDRRPVREGRGQEEDSEEWKL